MPSRAQLEKYTQLLGMINPALPMAAQLGLGLFDFFRQLQTAIGNDNNLTAEQKAQLHAQAQASLDQFKAEVAKTKTQIDNWLATHPPTNDQSSEEPD